MIDDHQEHYEYHEIEFEVTSPEIQKHIELVTFVRSPVIYSLKILNPLDVGSTFSASVDNDDIRVNGLPEYLENHTSVSILKDFVQEIDIKLEKF